MVTPKFGPPIYFCAEESFCTDMPFRNFKRNYEGAKTFVRVKRFFSAKINPPKRWPIFGVTVRCVLASLTQDAGVEISQRLFWCDQAPRHCGIGIAVPRLCGIVGVISVAFAAKAEVCNSCARTQYHGTQYDCHGAWCGSLCQINSTFHTQKCVSSVAFSSRLVMALSTDGETGYAPPYTVICINLGSQFFASTCRWKKRNGLTFSERIIIMVQALFARSRGQEFRSHQTCAYLRLHRALNFSLQQFSLCAKCRKGAILKNSQENKLCHMLESLAIRNIS